MVSGWLRFQSLRSYPIATIQFFGVRLSRPLAKLPELGCEDRYRAGATLDNFHFDYRLKVLGQRSVRSQAG